jgi:hypothetical protein
LFFNISKGRARLRYIDACELIRLFSEISNQEHL